MEEKVVSELWYQDPETWVAIAFTIFALLAVKFLVPLIGKGLDGRANQIRDQLEQATRLRAEAEALLATYKAQQEATLKEAEAIVAAAKKDAENLRTRAAEDLKLALDRRTQQAQEKIARAESDAVAEIRTQLIEGATTAAREMIVEHLSGAKEDPSVAQAISSIERQIH